MQPTASWRIASWAGARLASAGGDGLPYWVAVAALLGCVVVVTVFHRLIAHLDDHLVESPEEEALAVTAGDA